MLQQSGRHAPVDFETVGISAAVSSELVFTRQGDLSLWVNTEAGETGKKIIYCTSYSTNLLHSVQQISGESSIESIVHRISILGFLLYEIQSMVFYRSLRSNLLQEMQSRCETLCSRA
ncbi:hypothetical protein AML91_07220 [Paenibacillus jilunlii]|uniref:Uncharacterized protein n=1 Tax=Paenibacillus jilunlii TaxID=682956 RepID=A0ABR5SZE1_9BACL|nr:hypothetical protein AML91_07220 [Paenibacillus jilunlii]